MASCLSQCLKNKKLLINCSDPIDPGPGPGSSPDTVPDNKGISLVLYLAMFVVFLLIILVIVLTLFWLSYKSRSKYTPTVEQKSTVDDRATMGTFTVNTVDSRTGTVVRHSDVP